MVSEHNTKVAYFEAFWQLLTKIVANAQNFWLTELTNLFFFIQAALWTAVTLRQRVLHFDPVQIILTLIG